MGCVGLGRITLGILPLDYDLHNSSFLHRVCLNKNVTLEIVEYLLDLYPEAVNFKKGLPKRYIVSAYPLHLACYNKDCPNEVIQLILKKSVDYQLTQISYMDFDYGDTDIIVHERDDYYGGFPLHFYLSRKSNVDLGIVKQLAADPVVLLSPDEKTKCTPFHILLNNENIGEMFDVVKYLAESSPSSLMLQDQHDRTPLHLACRNTNITARTVQILLQDCPEAVYQRNNCDELPIYNLCAEEKNKTQMDDEVAKDVLNLFLEAQPDLVTHIEDELGYLPIHSAATNKSQAFCKILVDAYPESVRIGDGDGSLPIIHKACYNDRLDTVESLLRLYPESVHIRNNDGKLPIHEVSFPKANNLGKNATKIIELLLIHDPECLSKPVVFVEGNNAWQETMRTGLPLHIVCCSYWDESKVATLLFNLYPEAILIRNEQEQLPIDIVREKIDSLGQSQDTDSIQQRLQYTYRFLLTQMDYAYKAQDADAMRTPDCAGSLLHIAMRSGAPLGSIKSC